MSKLSKPAYISAIAYLVVIVMILLPFNVKNSFDIDNETKISNKYVFTQRVFLVLLMAVPFALSVYSINCFAVGKCFLWSYLHSILVVVWVLLFVLGTVISSQSQIEVFSNALKF
jgi:ABC-type sulfate transport system permease subunit